ncbi:LysR substrate-binding domain-containing protein [Novosphingobium sp. 1949]|uniref:LysR substrate-binding domain-containing protein n=1 Tax=Novosphingobium organovorum TaxID=2930092 RepID=A0ABT0BHZ2_9SPHN|nr:LysR substrate-binding domain-containing protein [Novosphingobium organovorum]MCJ2184583.1 LysR substrate-binding domain-containing protein [Novosphingobium organovorum]
MPHAPLIPADLLQSFVAVVEAGSFTGAGRALGLGQSTVSQHIARLEALTRRRLIDRDTHHLSLSAEGERLLGHARSVLEAHARLAGSLAPSALRGRLRLGASEDFVLSALPDVLAAFARRHPEVDLEVRGGLSHDLYEAYDAGRLDVIFVKRRSGDRRGTLAWREPVRWIAHPDIRLHAEDPLPLLLYPPPSITRAAAIATLEHHARAWRVAFTSSSLTGLSAAARAGIGIMPHSARLMPPGLAVASLSAALPPLPDVEFVVLGPGETHLAAGGLIAAILQWAEGALAPLTRPA